MTKQKRPIEKKITLKELFIEPIRERALINVMYFSMFAIIITHVSVGWSLFYFNGVAGVIEEFGALPAYILSVVILIGFAVGFRFLCHCDNLTESMGILYFLGHLKGDLLIIELSLFVLIVVYIYLAIDEIIKLKGKEKRQ